MATLTPDQQRNLIIGGVAAVVAIALALFFTLGRGDGAVQTTSTAPAAVQLQPAGVTTTGGAVAIIPPPTPLEAQLGDVKNLDKFVQDKYRELKDEAERQRAQALQTVSLYQTQRLTEAARRTR